MCQNNFSENLKKIRKQKGMTQAKLAELLNVSVMTIRRLEAGTRVPKLKTIEELAKVLEVDPMELTFGDDVYIKTSDKLIFFKKGKIKEAIEKLNQQQYDINPDFDYKKSNEQIKLKQDTIAKYDSLNTLGQQKANEYITDLSEQEKYTKPDNED